MLHLSGDSAIEFASGQITSLAAAAHLLLDGNDAFIEDSTALGSNSALTGLASTAPERRSISKTAPRCRRPARSSMTDPSCLDGNIGYGGGSSLTVGGDADQHRHAGYRQQRPFLVRLRYGEILRQ